MDPKAASWAAPWDADGDADVPGLWWPWRRPPGSDCSPPAAAAGDVDAAGSAGVAAACG